MDNQDLQYLFTERVAIITEDNIPEGIAIAQATWEVRELLVLQGLTFLEANLKVMGIRKESLNELHND